MTSAEHEWNYDPPLVATLMLSPVEDSFQELGAPLVRYLQRRCRTIIEFTEGDERWQEWGRATPDGGCVIDTDMTQGPAKTVITDTDQFVSVESDFRISDFTDVGDNVAAGLRFVSMVEQVLRRLRPFLQLDPPASLGRTRREMAWLRAGGQDPGPADVGSVRRRGGVRAMGRTAFWEVIERLKAGPVDLDDDDAESFQLTARTLVDHLDNSEARRAADRVIGVATDDMWDDVRGWVLSLGKKTYQQVVRDPGCLEVLLRELESLDDLSVGELLLYGDLSAR